MKDDPHGDPELGPLYDMAKALWDKEDPNSNRKGWERFLRQLVLHLSRADLRMLDVWLSAHSRRWKKTHGTDVGGWDEHDQEGA